MMQQKRNINVGKIKLKTFSYFILFFLVFFEFTFSLGNTIESQFVEIKILDKVSSKTSQLSLKIEKESKFENLIIKILKCKNSEFDDNPEVTAYMQVKDLTIQNNVQNIVATDMGDIDDYDPGF